HDIGKQERIGLAQLAAIDVSPETVSSELTNNRLRPDLGVCLQLVERLDCRQPCYTAPAAPAALMLFAVDRGSHSPFPVRQRFRSTIARQARAAAPPWSLPSGEARARACASFSTVRMP